MGEKVEVEVDLNTRKAEAGAASLNKKLGGLAAGLGKGLARVAGGGGAAVLGAAFGGTTATILGGLRGSIERFAGGTGLGGVLGQTAGRLSAEQTAVGRAQAVFGLAGGTAPKEDIERVLRIIQAFEERREASAKRVKDIAGGIGIVAETTDTLKLILDKTISIDDLTRGFAEVLDKIWRGGPR